MHGLNWKNFFVVIERDAGTAAIIDGDTKKIITHIDTGYAVHVIKGTEHHKVDHAKDVGRFWYTIGRDGKVNKIDLWQTPEKMLVAETKMAYDARDIAVSGDGKYVIAGGYWPSHFVIMDAETLNLNTAAHKNLLLVVADADIVAADHDDGGTATTATGNALQSIGLIDAAIETVNTQRSELGAVSNRLNHTVNNLTNVSANLSSAKGRIEDTDYAIETTNLVKNQILQQASTAMLAQANASKQNVLVFCNLANATNGRTC